jgi:SAM-dependent methyltransferase
MAIDILSFRLLLRVAPLLPSRKRALVLGRQHFLTPVPSDRRMQRQSGVYQKILREAGHDRDLATIIDADGFCDSFFRLLGFGAVDYMDISDYEGANVLHDLNDPLPDALAGRYDFIFDGGTTEHVFDVPQAFRNYDRALRTGGQLMAMNPANNWPGHGFYQFGPEIVWSYWRDAAGYAVRDCTVIGMRDWYGRQAITVDPPEARGTERDDRLRTRVGTGISLLVYRVEKPAEATRGATAQQSDYRATWERA